VSWFGLRGPLAGKHRRGKLGSARLGTPAALLLPEVALGALAALTYAVFFLQRMPIAFAPMPLLLLIAVRLRAAREFDRVFRGNPLFRVQRTLEDCTSTYWAYAVVLETDQLEDWYLFRDLFMEAGGKMLYAAWKLTYNETLFQNGISLPVRLTFPAVLQSVVP
jgi:hypothetical protein